MCVCGQTCMYSGHNVHIYVICTTLILYWAEVWLFENLNKQAKNEKPTQVCLNAPAGQPAVQNTKKKTEWPLETAHGHLHTHTHTLHNPPPPLRSLLDIASLLKHPVASQRSPTFPSTFRRVRTPRAIGHYGNPTLQRLVTSFTISTAPSNFN